MKLFLERLRMIYYCYIVRNRNLYSKKLGVKMGEGCNILANPYICFGSEPWLIKLGDHVRITEGVKFYTHDGAIWVARYLNDNLSDADSFAPVTVGNNVMIGVRSQIMPGITIGDNVIIGAGSIVTKNVPSNTVVGGAPAKKISTIDKYIEKVISKSVHTKKMTQEQKKIYLEENYQEWFD